MHLSMCCPTPPPPPGRGRAYMGDLTLPQVKFPLTHQKTGHKRVFTMQSQVQIPQYGANISGQIRSNSPVCPGGGVVGQHVDRCIRNVHRNNQTAMDKIMRTLLIAVSWFTICIKTITQVHAFHFNFHFEVLLPLCSPALPISFLFLPTITEKCPFNHNHTYVSMQSQVCVCLGVVSSGVGRGGLTGLEPPPF